MKRLEKFPCVGGPLPHLGLHEIGAASGADEELEVDLPTVRARISLSLDGGAPAGVAYFRLGLEGSGLGRASAGLQGNAVDLTLLPDDYAISYFGFDNGETVQGRYCAP